MENQFKLDYNGQQVQQQDFAGIGETSGLADDRVLAELLRLPPYTGTVAKGILPYGYAGATPGTVVPNGAAGSVLVNPFRAIVGARTAVGTDAQKAWRDIRSGLAVAAGDTSLTHTVSLAANSSGNPRWDLVYASVTVDTNGPSVVRKVKDPTTKVVTSQTVATYKVTSVTIDKVTGTASATPAYPATPTDAGGVYYIPLAYVRVPNGFNGTSTVDPHDINEVASIFGLSPLMGGVNARPADGYFKTGGAAISGAGTSPVPGVGPFKWTGTAATKPALYFPPSMRGEEVIWVPLDLNDASSANWSHQNGDIIDASIDWRNRIFDWMAYWNNSGIVKWDWSDARAGAGGHDPSFSAHVGANQGFIHGFGASFHDDPTGGYGHAVDLWGSGSGGNCPAYGVGVGVVLHADASTGALKVLITGTPACSLFIKLRASGQFANR